MVLGLGARTGHTEGASAVVVRIHARIAEVERSLILERQREGIALAKARGVSAASRANAMVLGCLPSRPTEMVWSWIVAHNW